MSSAKNALYTATWTADEVMQRLAASKGASWPHRVCLTQESLYTLEDYGFAQVMTRCPATADLLGFCDVELLCPGSMSRRLLHREGPGQAWQLVGVSSGDVQDLEPLDSREFLSKDARPLFGSARLLPPQWQCAFAAATSYVLTQAITQRPISCSTRQESKVTLPALDTDAGKQFKVVPPPLDSQQAKVASPAMRGSKAVKGVKASPFGNISLAQLLMQSLPSALAAAPVAGQAAKGQAPLGHKSLVTCSSGPMLEGRAHTYLRSSHLVPL